MLFLLDSALVLPPMASFASTSLTKGRRKTSRLLYSSAEKAYMSQCAILYMQEGNPLPANFITPFFKFQIILRRHARYTIISRYGVSFHVHGRGGRMGERRAGQKISNCFLHFFNEYFKNGGK